MFTDKLSDLYGAAKETAKAKLSEAYTEAVAKVLPANSVTPTSTPTKTATKKKKPAIPAKPAPTTPTVQPVSATSDDGEGIGTGVIVAVLATIAAAAFFLTR